MTNHAEEMMSALQLGQVDQAQKAFDLSLKEDSDDLVFSLAEDLYAMGFVDESKQAYQQLLAKHPDEDQLKSSLAELAIEEDQLEEAQDYLAQISPDSEAYLQSLLVKADLYQQEGLQESAELSLTKARQLAPDEPIVTFALAEFYFSTGEYNKAISLYRSLLLQGQRRIAKVDMAARIGTAYAAVGNVENAIAYLEQIKPLDLTIDTKFQLAFLYQEQGQIDQAIDLYEEILDQDPHYTSVYPLLGQAQEKANEKKGALQTYQAGLSYDQTNPLLYRLTGNLAFQLADDSLAEESYKKALALDDLDLTTIAALADFYLAKHDYDQTIRVIKEAGEKDLVDPKFNWDLARAYHAKELDEQAKPYWQQAFEDYPADTDFLHDLADWYHETGQIAAEKETIERLLAITPDDFEMEGRLADLED
ncbi:tetratricopeptide repeat protein [Fructobacillus parabroussonetiae]|uniref:Tetratricopeptide repeat protein n=1 Tax=Fructobacillus parabroussonetiae TaxID=2713174 RepID=A0ABS5QXE2_9LACO|nr:tetratricopeptide repeat protein [Fructobacillus parabroussonetiae]MBS9337472.1 tetratricopeptide repeat protein [Fructobacillus parabroussonetiae]MCK8617001.1 tetratricopeptide repeat protein [Fructobacillus parabroussonetiae]